MRTLQQLPECNTAFCSIAYCDTARSPHKISYSHLLHLRQIFIKYAEKIRKIIFYIPNAHLSYPTSNIMKSLQFSLKPILARNKRRAQNFCTDLMGKKAWANNHGSLRASGWCRRFEYLLQVMSNLVHGQ